MANAVHELLGVAGRSGGIGEQVREIARNQEKEHAELEVRLNGVLMRGPIYGFFFGPDHSAINGANDILEQNNARVRELEQIKEQLKNQGDAQKLEQQIRVLEKANMEIQEALEGEQNRFSLFGWMFRLFAR